jgi:hypothetical protein
MEGFWGWQRIDVRSPLPVDAARQRLADYAKASRTEWATNDLRVMMRRDRLDVFIRSRSRFRRAATFHGHLREEGTAAVLSGTVGSPPRYLIVQPIFLVVIYACAYLVVRAIGGSDVAHIWLLIIALLLTFQLAVMLTPRVRAADVAKLRAWLAECLEGRLVED